MPSDRRPSSRPNFEVLESRLALNASAAAFASGLRPHAAARRGGEVAESPPSSNVQGAVDIDLTTFAAAYGSRVGRPAYNPAADFNSDGVVNEADARVILNSLAPVTPRQPLSLSIRIASADLAHYKAPTVSGGATFNRDFTIIGRTTPNSLVIEDNHTARLPGGTQAFKFPGPAHATDANGFFTFQSTNNAGINNNNFLVITPFGGRLVRSFPVFWIPYATGKGF
jgi:hypothetical protein